MGSEYRDVDSAPHVTRKTYPPQAGNPHEVKENGTNQPDPGRIGNAEQPRERTALARPLPAPHYVHRPRLGHRHGPVLRFRLRDSAGRPLRTAGLRHRRRGGVHGDACDGRARPGTPGRRRVLRVRDPLPGPLGRFRDRLDLRPRDGAGGRRGRDRLRRVHEVLVPEQSLVDLDCLGAADPARH